MRLEDTTVRALTAPNTGQKLYRDDTLAGFACRVSQGGTKTFVLIHGRDRRFITIGRYPIISLSEARTEAKRLLAEFMLGKTRPHSITYSQAVELFLADRAQSKRPSTIYSYKTLLQRFNFKCQLAEITPHETARRLDRIKAPSARSHLLVAGKVFFNWCIKRRYITDNPLLGLHKPKYLPRERVLSNDELKDIWDACEECGQFGTVVRLLILTGQRRGEISAFRHEYLEGSVCTFPPSLTKNHRLHSFPIGPLAQNLFASLSKSLPAPLHFTDWGKSKANLDTLSGTTNWTLHDLRRTFATGLADMGTAPHVIERILNHVSGTISGIAAVYNKARYFEEMRAAVEAWDVQIQALVTDTEVPSSLKTELAPA